MNKQLTTLKALSFLTALIFTIGAHGQQEEILQAPAEAEVDTEGSVLDPANSPSKATPLPLEEIRTFAEIFERIKQAYVEPVSDEKLLEYAVQGMIQGIDPHSAYIKDEALEDLDEGTTGQFGGLGLEVMMEDGFLKVIAPIDDTPASEAGILSGDLIIKINGNTVSGSDLQEASNKLRGKPGTKITITVLRESADEPFDVELKRAVVRLESVKRKRLSDEVGYLRVTRFQTGTAEIFRKQLKMMMIDKKLRGLIIDLRNNPGGLLNSAIAISDLFIDGGNIVSTKGRVKESDTSYDATPSDILNGLPIVVMINGGSASASEIVAGALQDHKRALVLGTESFGKGSVQTVMNMSDTQALKLTTARYYTPSGRSIQAAGIVPDVLVEWREFKEKKSGYQRIKEDDLPGHLENEEKLSAEKIKQNKQRKEWLDEDYQLQEAYNLLKGLVLYQTEG